MTSTATFGQPGIRSRRAHNLPEQRTSATRLAVICDYPDEGWTSMDLCAEMLHKHLAAQAGHITTSLLCPSFRRRVSRLPILGQHGWSFNADRVLNRFWDYPFWLQRQQTNFDLFHLVDHCYAQLVHQLPAERTIVTCNDIDAFRCLLNPARNLRSIALQVMARRILAGLRKAARVTCISAATRDELLAHELVSSERLVVMHVGVDAVFAPRSNPLAESEVEQHLGRQTRDGIDLLHVGSTIPRKRIDVLLRVFAAVRHRFPHVRLLRAGGEFTTAQLELVRQLQLQDSILVLPFVSRDALAAIYRRATLVLQPSESEGFGLPVAEALACGAPVVASDLAVLREVGGAAAAYCPVGDIASWSNTICTLLGQRTSQPGDWEQRRTTGLVQAAKFSWQRYADQMVNVYGDVLAAARK